MHSTRSRSRSRSLNHPAPSLSCRVCLLAVHLSTKCSLSLTVGTNHFTMIHLCMIVPKCTILDCVFCAQCRVGAQRRRLGPWRTHRRGNSIWIGSRTTLRRTDCAQSACTRLRHRNQVGDSLTHCPPCNANLIQKKLSQSTPCSCLKREPWVAWRSGGHT